MSFSFNPTPAESALLSQVAVRESGASYTAQNPTSTASGAYQFINSTWAMASAATGVPYYPTAATAPPSVQDTNALWLLRTYGVNSSTAWQASGPYDTSTLADAGGSIPGAMVDLSGGSASTPTADILTSLESSVGLDPASPVTDLVIAAAVGAVVWMVMR